MLWMSNAQCSAAEVRPGLRVLKLACVLWSVFESIGGRGSTRLEGTEILSRLSRFSPWRCGRGSTRLEGTEISNKLLLPQIVSNAAEVRPGLRVLKLHNNNILTLL